MLLRAWLVGTLLLCLPTKLLACGRSELDQFIEAAQTLSPQTAASGRKLLLCPDEVARAQQWLAFYQGVHGAQAGGGKAPMVAPRLKVASDIQREVAAAYLGNGRQLQEQVESGDPRFTSSSEARLALARALARNREFADSRQAYVTYLRMQPNSYAEEIEYLYTYIWEGDLGQAEHALATADVSRTPAYYAESIKRGQNLIAMLRQDHHTDAGESPDRQLMADAYVEGFTIKDQMQRLSTQLEYRGIVGGRFRHHLVKSLIYERAVINTDEFWLGSQHTFKDKLSLSAYAGYLTYGDKHYLGEASASLKLPGDVKAGIGADRRPLFTTVALAKPDFGVLEDRAWGELAWREKVTLRGAYLRDGDLPPFESYGVALRQQLKSYNHHADLLNVLAELNYEARSTPSPYYESFRKTYGVRLGGATSHRIDEALLISTEFAYVLFLRQAFGSTSTASYSGADLKAQISSEITKTFHLVGKLAYSAVETDRPAQPMEHRFAVIGGIELLR